jgi:SAM-dependent methyltransferase
MVADFLRKRSRLLKPIARLYGQRLAECGPTPNGVYWRSSDGQMLRFEMLLGIVDPTDAAQGKVTINDLGCGYGALFDRLADDPMMIDGRYHGYDISPEMIREAKARHMDRRADFIVAAGPTREADYSVASGTFNMSMGNKAMPWRDYVFDSLAELWSKTRKGLAFNMLAGTGADKPGGLYYANAQDYFHFCTAHLSPKVELHQGYGMDEWTMYVRR